MKTALVLGGGGFIGSHLVKRLKREGYWVRAVDLKYPRWSKSPADDFIIGDLRERDTVEWAFDKHPAVDECYQLAADMGGAGYLFTGENDAAVMHNSALINLNVAQAAVGRVGRLFYASSACVYPKRNQEDPNAIKISEETAYPADPDSEYGWEKLFSERLYAAFHRCRDLCCRIARFHNVYGPEGSYNDGREKAPAAICRKVAEAEDGGDIEIWGDGNQTRSFLFIEDAIDAVRLLMQCDDDPGPINIGSEEMVTINQLAQIAIGISVKSIAIKHVPGPVGVMARTSDNTSIMMILGWEPKVSLIKGIATTYNWIEREVHRALDQR